MWNLKYIFVFIKWTTITVHWNILTFNEQRESLYFIIFRKSPVIFHPGFFYFFLNWKLKEKMNFMDPILLAFNFQN